MDKVIRAFDTHQQADAASFEDAQRLTTAERLEAFLQMMKPLYESSGEGNWTQDFKEFIELAISAKLKFLVIGGWAFNRYAEPRMTREYDFFVDDSLELAISGS